MNSVVRKSSVDLSSHGSHAAAIVTSFLTRIVTWHRALLHHFAPLQGSWEAPANPAPQDPWEAVLERRLVGFLLRFDSGVQGFFAVILTGQTRLGSGSPSDIVIDSKYVSTHHASLYVDPDTEQVFVVDEESLNGTFVNEKKVEPGERRQMRDEDHLRLGTASFVVKLVAAEDRGGAPVPHAYR